MVALALGWLAWSAAGLYVEWFWFHSLGYGGVLARQAGASALLFLVGAALFGVLYVANLRMARRFGSADRDEAVAGDRLWTYLARVSAGLGGGTDRGRRAERALLIAGLIVTLGFGLAAAGARDVGLLALHGAPFGLVEPLFGRDAGFYVFTLPLLRGVYLWLLAALAVIGLATVVAYLLRGWFELGLRPRLALVDLGYPARLHLAALGAALFLLVALHHQLSLAEVVFASSGQAFRLSFPGYAEANAQVPMLWLMTLGALVAALALLWVARAPSGRRLALGPLIWLGVLVIGTAYPAAVQALVVKPNEALVERPYLANVLAMARVAYGVDGLVERAIPAETAPGPRIARDNLPTLSNVRLWEPEPLRLSLNQLQAGKPYYGFFLYPDVDRYRIDGTTRTLMVAARELDPQALPARSWVNTRLQYTHGYGVVASAAGAVGPDGRPVLIERDIPSQGDLRVTRPEIYFGERTFEPVYVRTAEPEVDYQRGDENALTRYAGTSGVPVGNPLARLTHAWRLPDLNLLLSPAIDSETILLHRRQIAERVHRLAPFLLLDADPFPVVYEGRLVWMLDGYTASDRFPLAPRAQGRLLAADPRPGVTRSVEPNYLHGAAKITVDAYDGSVRFYLLDEREPIASAYARIYPDLFQPLAALPVGLREHLRYPRQLFGVQAEIVARFHTGDPAQLYSGEEAWLVARGRFDARPDPVPAYALQRLPGEAGEEFVLTLPFRPYSQSNDRHNLVALLAARSDGPRYGELVLYRYPRDRLIEGPFQAEVRIDQDPNVSSQFGLWQRSGAQVIRGEMQTVPLDNLVVYVESIYLQRPERAALPELQRVVTVAGSRVAMEPTLEASLASLFGASSSLAAGGAAAPTDRQAAARELALSAQEHLRRAQDALLVGDRARHDQELQAALADLQRLAEASR